jgi:hypothetical protein
VHDLVGMGQGVRHRAAGTGADVMRPAQAQDQEPINTLIVSCGADTPP